MRRGSRQQAVGSGQTPSAGDTQLGMTLVEIMLGVVLSAIVILPIWGILQLAMRRWNQQASYGLAMQTTNVALQAVQSDGLNAIDWSSTVETGGNTLYYFILPDNKDATNTYYVPEIVNSAVEYVPGPESGYYLSDLTGSLTVTNGTNLWHATKPLGGSWTPDTSWSLVNTSMARCPNVTTLSFNDASSPSNAVQVTITASYTEGTTTNSYTQVRQVYFENHN